MRNRISWLSEPVRITDYGGRCWLRAVLDGRPSRPWVAYGLEWFETGPDSGYVSEWSNRVAPMSDPASFTVANPTATTRLLLGIMDETGADVVLGEAPFRPLQSRTWRTS